MTSILLANATLLDPATGRETRGAVLVQDGRIADIAEGAAPGLRRTPPGSTAAGES